MGGLLHKVCVSSFLFVFALASIGGNGCLWDNKLPPPTQKLRCLTDPPVGCAAVCAAEGTPGFTAACSDVSAGPLAAQFEQRVAQGISQAMMQGIEVCPADKVGGAVTPCMLGISAQEWPNQDHSVCDPTPFTDCSGN